jgi:hypothetical protein
MTPAEIKREVRAAEAVYVMTDFGLSVRLSKKEASRFIDRCAAEGPWDMVVEGHSGNILLRKVL